MMQAREYLKQVGKLQRQADLKWRQVQSMRSALSVGSAPMDSEHVSHTRNVDRMGERVATLVDAEYELDALVDKLFDLKREIISLLDHLETEEALYLTERYLNLKLVEDIAKEQDVSTRWVYEIISNAISHLQPLLDAAAETS